jgi:hypothetical protein
MRALLVSAAVVGALLCGCGTGPASIGAGPAATADPGLHGSAGQQPPPGSAAGVAEQIAARWSAPGVPPFTRNLPIEFRTLDYTATVFSPGSPEGFTAFITTRRTTVVTTTSAATIVASNGASVRFATPSDQARWQAAGRPSLGQAPATDVMQTIPAGQYTFVPQGRNLTYRQAAGLPAQRDSLAAVLGSHLSAYAGPHPAAGLELKEVAYLIATAPLTDKVRAAAWQVIASLPGLSICPDLPGQAGPGAIGLCIGSSGDEILVNVDPGTGAIVAIADRLTQTSPAYPHVAAGTIVESSTFLSG